MQTYESDIKTIRQSQEQVFELLGDLNNFNRFQEAGSAEMEQASAYLKDVEITSDEIRVDVTGVGKIGFRIIEREPHKTIKFETNNSPVDANAWIQLLPLPDNSTKMKVTLKLKLSMMLKMMLDSKLKKGVNMIADTIADAINSQNI